MNNFYNLPLLGQPFFDKNHLISNEIRIKPIDFVVKIEIYISISLNLKIIVIKTQKNQLETLI